MHYSPRRSEQFYYGLGAKNRCMVREANRIGLIYLTTLVMVPSVMYTICEGPELDALEYESVTPTNPQYESIRQHKQLSSSEKKSSL